MANGQMAKWPNGNGKWQMANGKWPMAGEKAVKTFWLSMHAPYSCRESGACCSSGWPIPLERSRLAGVQVLRGDRSWLVPAPHAPADVAGVLAVSGNGHCVFHRNGCEIQHVLGASSMPAACQHFPREVLIDPRGVFVTLSHYCPTAADLLFEDAGAVAIVEGPPAIAQGEPEGLDARGVLPPLLVAGVLMDYEGYSAWESHLVHQLTNRDDRTAEEALEDLWRDLALLQRWHPGPTSMAAAVARMSQSATTSRVEISHRPCAGTRAADERAVRRYLAARAFASWMAYQGGGIAAVLGSLALSLSALRTEIAHQDRLERHASSSDRLKEAIRATDRWLLHDLPRAELVDRSRRLVDRRHRHRAHEEGG
jgi:hypothetical protein